MSDYITRDDLRRVLEAMRKDPWGNANLAADSALAALAALAPAEPADPLASKDHGVAREAADALPPMPRHLTEAEVDAGDHCGQDVLDWQDYATRYEAAYKAQAQEMGRLREMMAEFNRLTGRAQDRASEAREQRDEARAERDTALELLAERGGAQEPDAVWTLTRNQFGGISINGDDHPTRLRLLNGASSAKLAVRVLERDGRKV